MTMSNSESRKRLAEGVLPPTHPTKHRERLDEINGAACTCPYTDPNTWLSAASCGYGSGYEPGSMQEWNPDCPVHLSTHDAAHAEFEAETARIMGWDESAVEALARVIVGGFPDDADDPTMRDFDTLQAWDRDAMLGVARAVFAAGYQRNLPETYAAYVESCGWISPNQARELQREAWEMGRDAQASWVSDELQASRRMQPMPPRSTNPFGAAS